MADTPNISPEDIAKARDKDRADRALDSEPKLLQPVPKGQVAVTSPYGETGLIDESALPGALKEGYRPSTQTELHHQQVKELYGDSASQLATAAVGASDAMTFGFGKGILHKAASVVAGKDAADKMSDAIGYGQEANPTSWALGQGVGFLLPILGGPLGALEEGVGQSVARVAGKGILSAGASLGARGAAEGAIYSFGNSWSEAEIANKDMAAEMVMMDMAKTALFTGGIGFGLGAAGAASGKVFSRAIGTVDKKFEGLPEYLYERALQPTPADQIVIKESIDEGNRLGSFIRNEPEIREAARGGKPEDIQKAVESVRKRIGSEIDQNIKSIDNLAKNESKSADAAKIMDSVHNEVIQPLERLPGYSSISKQVKNYMEEWGTKLGVLSKNETGEILRNEITNLPQINKDVRVSFKDLHEFRIGLDDLVNRGKKAMTGDVSLQTMQELNAVINKEIKQQLLEQFPEKGAEYERLAKQYRAAARTAEIAAKSGSRSESKGLGLGSLVGLHFFGLKGLALSVAGREVMARAPGWIAYQLDRAAAQGAIAHAAESQASKAAAVAKAIVNSGVRTSAAITLDRSKQAKKTAALVRQLAAQPEAVQKMVNMHIDTDHAPEMASKIALLNIQALQHLAAQAPKGTPIVPALPMGPTSDPSKSALNEWIKTWDIYSNPEGTISAAAKKGQLSAAHVTALEQYYPKWAQLLRQETMLELGRRVQTGKIPSYRARIQMGLILHAPTDASLDPAFIASQQAIASGMAEEDSYPNKGGPNVQEKSKVGRQRLSGGEDTMDSEGNK